MQKEDFFISKNDLNYAFIGQEISNNFTENYETTEIPSIFYLNLKYSDEIYLPITIFQNHLTPFQNIVKYLKENLEFNNKRISQLLNKEIKVIWATYKSIEKEKPLIVREEDLKIPLSVFKDTQLSTLEAMVCFLKKLDMNYAEISRLLHKDQRTIWTVNARAKNKMSAEKNAK